MVAPGHAWTRWVVLGLLIGAVGCASGGVGGDARDAAAPDIAIVPPADALDRGDGASPPDGADAPGADGADGGPQVDAPADALATDGGDGPPGGDASGNDGATKGPRIVSVTPPDGLATLPSPQVVIRGQGFSTTARLVFLDVAVPVADCDYAGVPERIVCTVPARAAGAGRGEVRITNPDGQTHALADAWTYTAVVAEADFCNVQFPRNMTVADGNAALVGMPREVYSQLYEPGLTTMHAGPAPGVTAQLGVSPRDPVGADLDPTRSNRWRYIPAMPNAGFPGFGGNNDEYVATLVPEQVGIYRYVYRYSLDGGIQFTYCDRDDTNNTFDPAQVSVLEVLAP